MSNVGGATFAHEPAPVFAALGAEVEDPVGVSDHIEIVLDDDDGVAEVGEAMQDFEQLAHIVEVEARGGLIEEIEGTACLALGEFAGQLHALGLSAAEGGGALAEVDVAEADVDEGLQFLPDEGDVGEDGQGVFNGEIEDVGDGVAFEFDGQGFLIIATPVTHLALDVDVGHEVHFDAALAIALAGFAAASGDVEAEAAGLVATFAGLGQHGE